MPSDRGLILADTKFEWGIDCRTGELLLVDEVLTPDSSRYWPKEHYQPWRPAALVRQAVRSRLAGVDRLGQGESPAVLPDDVVARTRDKYVDAYEILTGQIVPLDMNDSACFAT